MPDRLIDEVSLVGTESEIRARLDVWRSAGVGTLCLTVFDERTLSALPTLL